jgi:uncharacterized radical SAM protein YgiQ
MFLPTTTQELKQLGWDRLDVILVSGDSYIDSPFVGAAVIGKILLKAGMRVGIIAQPRLDTEEDITRLGEPELFWGVTGGCVDSMVSNYTASRKKRRSDDYTPGGENNRRPDRAVIAYTNLIRRHFKRTCPVVLGGIEASLRRVVHYDYWTDRLRGSILFDAKADILVYGMGETTTLELANCLRDNKDYRDLRGLCYIAKTAPEGYLELPSLESCTQDKQAFTRMFHLFYRNNDPLSAKGLSQRHGDRFLVQNPPAYPLQQQDLDAVYALDYQRAQHPYYEAQGKVKALETIRFSLSTHRGCYGECSFCAIAVHEGRTVSWRSPDSILAEAGQFASHPEYKGIIFDAGGPTANMYGFECDKKLKHGVCPAKRCVYPQLCKQLDVDQKPHLDLLKRLRKVPGVKKVFVASGLRYDLMLADQENGRAYLQELVDHHISGQMKVAPEHSVPLVLDKMGKPSVGSLIQFKKLFDSLNQAAGKQQYLTYYMIAAHPGCTDEDMRKLKEFAGRELKINPEQVQIFTPTPSTYSSLMYYTETDPFTGQPLFVEKDLKRKERQKEIVVEKNPRRGKGRG